MIEKGPGFNQVLDPLGSTPEVQKAPGFNSTRASLPVPLEQTTPSEQYSKDYQAGEPLNNYLSRSQGAWDEFGNLLTQTGIEALAGSVEAASYLGDWEQVASKLQGEEGEYTNWLAESMKALKEEGKTNWAPVYTNEENKTFNPSSFEWWAANGGQGLGSTLSLLIPGMTVSKLGKLAGLGELGQAVSAGLASRYAESTMEANQVYQDAITQGATPEKAGEAASKTWNTNWIFAIQDIAAFSQISKGTQALSKGVKGKGFLSWMGELGTQMATEGAEEAGQYVVSEEAKKTALNANIDYFGEGFNKRLSDYIHDDEFKTSTLLGAMGGGVFHTAGSILDKITDVEQGDLSNTYNTAKDKIRNLFSRGIQKEVANATGDTITSQKIDQITLGEQLANAINTGKLEQHKSFVEEESKKPDTAQEAKELYTNHLKTVEELTQEQAKLRNNPSIPEDLHKPILLKRLEIAQNNYLSKQAEQELQKEYTNLDQQGFNPILNPLKRSKTLADTYKVLALLHPELTPIAAQHQQAYQEQLNLAKQTDPSVEAKLVTPSDDKLFELTKQTISLNEQKPRLQDELSSLSTPEGIAAHRQKEANKKINAESQAILSKPNVTKEELLQAEKNATDPELKTAIAKKYQELVDKDRQDNLDQLGDIHEPDQSTIPVDDITPDDTVEPQEVNPNDEDINPYDNLTPDALGEFTPDDLEQRKKFGLTVEETKEIISGIDVETRQPKAKESTIKEEEIQAVESIKGKTTVSTTSLDKNSKGNPVEYISRYTGRKAKANEIIAIDPVTGQLLKNTPRVTIGQQVTLKLEKDYEWDQRNKPTYNEDNYTIAIYLEGVQKPIDFLRSADNKYMSQAEKDHNKALRKQIYDSPTQSIVTTIVDKNIGTPRLDETQKDITILEFDFALDTDGRWRMQRTSHNPILFNVDHLGNIKVPNTGSMNGIDQSTLDRVQHSVETYFTKSDLKKMAGQTGVFRTAPDGSFRAIALDYRPLNDQEKGWVKTSLSKLVQAKDFDTLSEVIYIPIQTGGIYNNTGDNNRAKVPDLFKKEKGKYVMDRKRFHISSSSFKTELLIPTTATKKNSEAVWISIEDKQLGNFLEGKDFTYKILTYEEGAVRTSDAKAVEPQKIRDVFDKMLDQQFKNLNADNINSERQYTDPVNGEVHPSFYDYLLKTQTVTTKLKGSKTLGVGEDSSYSFNQVSLYLDPNPSQTKITVDEEGLIHTIEDETKQEATKEDKELTDEELRRLFEEDAHLKPYTREGYTYSLMGEEEIEWFRRTIGDEFLEVAKGVDSFLAVNGVEAFGQFYNGLVKVAEYAPGGTRYHEGGHLLRKALTTPKEWQRILDEGSKVYNIERGQNKPKVEQIEQTPDILSILPDLVQDSIELNSTVADQTGLINNRNEEITIEEVETDHHVEEIEPAPTTEKGINNYYNSYDDYFRRRYIPKSYSGPRKKGELDTLLNSMINMLRGAYASIYNNTARQSVKYDKIRVPGETIPVTLRFLKNIKKSLNHSTNLDKPFAYKDATTKENEILNEFYNFIKYELDQFAQKTGKAVPKVIPNERLVEKLDFWLTGKYGVQTYEAPANGYPYGLSNIIKDIPGVTTGEFDLDEEQGTVPIYSTDPRTPNVTGGEVFISDGLHFPSIASGHNKSLGNSGVNSNTLGWYIDSEIEGDTFLYEFQSDIIPEVESGDFKFSLQRENTAPEQKEYVFRLIFADKGSSITISKDLSKEEIRELLQNKVNTIVGEVASSIAANKTAAERRMRGDDQPSSILLRENLHQAVEQASKPSKSILRDYLNARKDFWYLLKLLNQGPEGDITSLDEESTIKDVEGNILNRIVRNLRKDSSKAILEYLRYYAQATEQTTEKITRGGFTFDKIKVGEALLDLIKPEKTQRYRNFGVKKPNIFGETKPKLTDYWKAQNERKGKLIKQARTAQKKILSGKGKESVTKSNPNLIDEYYRVRGVYIRDFYENKYKEATKSYIEDTITNLERNVTEALNNLGVGEALDISSKSTVELQKDYEHWYKVMFEKFIKIALIKQKAKGKDWVYMPTYSSMKAIEGSSSTGMIYATPHEHLEDRLLEKANEKNKFELNDLTYSKEEIGNVGNWKFYKKSQPLDFVEITEEEYQAALQKYVKGKSVGPFYTALSKIKGISIIGLETPSWSSKPLLRVDISGYKEEELERFKPVVEKEHNEAQSGDYQIEEKIMEDFERYQLSNGKVKPKVAKAKGFFRRLLQMIKSLVGLRSPLEKLFAKFDQGLTLEQRDRILANKGLNTNDEVKLKRLPGFFSALQQKATVGAFASEVMRLANEAAQRNNIHVFDLLSKQENVNKVFSEVKNNFTKDFDRIVESGRQNIEKGRYASYLAMGIGVAIGDNSVYNGNYEDIQREGLNPVDGFKTTVLRELTNWGFRVRINTKTEERKQLDDDTQEDLEDRDDETSERVFGKDSVELDPTDSLSARMRSFLSTIPEGGVDRVFGTPKFINFKKVDASLKMKLADSITPLTKLEQLAQKDPVIDSVLKALESERAEGNTQLYTEFFMKYKLDTQIEKTAIEETVEQWIPFSERTQSEIDRGIEKRRVSKIKLIDTDRTSADKSLINRWREEAVSKRLIDTHGEVKIDLVKPIQDEFEVFKAKFNQAKDKKDDLPYEVVKSNFISITTKLGITIPEGVWLFLDDKTKHRSNELQRWLIGDRSLDSMLSRLMDGKSPYSESSSGLLADIARKSAPYIGDLGRGAYRSDDGKQKFSINLPSYITEFFNRAKQDSVGLLDKFKNDPRYAKNAFLGVIRDNNHRTKIGVTFSSAIRQGDKDPKAFDDRTEIESILYRLTAYHNNAGNYALINVGTPADKGKQPMAILPKERKALDFLRTVLTNNIDYEVLRIGWLNEYTGLREALQSKIDSQQELTPEEQRLNRHIQANPLPTDIKNLKDSARFKYIPALDSIPNLIASVSKGDISAQQHLEARKQAATVIDKFIENEYQSFLKFLDDNDIISTKQNKDGQLEFGENIRISEGVLTTMVKGKEVQSGSFEAFLKEFFYNDLGWRLEMSKVFQGDLALYSNQDDYYKRQYQNVTPGYKPQTRLSTKSTVTRLVYAKQFKRSTIDELVNIGQMIRPSVTKAQVEDAIKNGSTDPLFKSIILKYQDINKTDAQSLMSMHAHKSIAEAVGQWTKEHEQVYQFAWKDDVTVAKAISDKRKNNSITEEEATNIRIMAGKVLMQPFKPFLIRDVEVKLPNGQVMMIKEQVKDSVTVITPELANTSLGYKDLLAYMKERRVDIASAEDTVKVGSYGVINLNDNDSSKWPIPAEWQKRVTNIEDIRFPQFISEDKKEEISGTQAHKLVVANIDDKVNYTIDDKEKTGKWVKEQYNELWAEKIIESAKELKTKLGLSNDSLKLSTDPDKRNKQIYKLWELLKQELSEREINENYKDVIELEKKINGTVDFTIPISFPAFGPKFQSILTNLWKKNILKQKSAGYSAINMADWGVNYSDELKFVTNSAGDIIEAEIGLPIDYVNDIGLEYGTHINRLNGAVLMDKLNENQKKALQFILYRIPTSNKSSMIPVRVARITPKHLNNIVIIPGELTIQQGLDFDVDKSQLLKRVLADGKIDKENTDTKIFDLYWGVLTNKAHTEEMITPLASPTLEAKQNEFKTKGILENVEATSPFTPQSDIGAEIRNKDGKAEIGIASRYNTGHAVLQMIKDYVFVQASIGIDYKGNSFSSIGDKNAIDGSLISTNHGESQQAALDAAKNPLLAYFNVVKGTMAGFHTMIEFGIPLGVVVDFYMQPVVREWTKFYKHEEQSKDRATDKLFTRYAGIKAQYDLLQSSIKPLTPEALEKGLEDGLTDTEHSARVLYEFLNVLNIAEQMTNINNVLSVDTFKDATSLESLQAFLEQLKNATDPSKPIYVDKRIFDLETTPTEGKRLAAFFKYGVQDAIDYISQFYPSTSEVYQEVRDTYADITKQSLTNKNLLKKLNQFTDYFMLQGDSSLFSLLTRNHPLYNVDPKLDKSYYRLRWTFFDPNTSLYDLIQKMVRAKDKDSNLKYPTLVNNEFIKGLISEESRTNQVQVFGVRNTDGNQDKTDYINGWYALMQSNDPDITTLAHDLVRYSIQTSGFNYSTRSFYDLIPVQYLIESGVASLWEQLTKAPQAEPESTVVNFIRHNFRNLDRFPTLYGKTVKGIFRSDNILDVKMKENRMEGFTLKSSFLKDEELPRFYRINDYNLGEYRLYESNPSNIREFREVAPLGGKNWVEVSPDRVVSQHSEIRSQKVGTPDPWNTKQFNLEGSTGTGSNEFLKKYLPEDTNKAKTVLEALLANEVDIEAKKGLEVLLRNVDKINTPIEIGYVTPGNLATFRITKNAVTSDITTKIVVNSSANLESDSDLRYVLHHELTHAYGTGTLQKPEGELQINYVRNINRVFEDAKKRSDLQDEYGLTSIYEFHAELASNKEFRKKLRRTDLWSRILRAIRKLLGLKDTYDKVLDQYYTVLDQVEELQKINPGEFALKIEEKKKAVKKQNPIEQMHSNLKARIKRLKGQGKNITAEDLALKFAKLQKMEEAQQMVDYILLVDDEMKSVKTLYKSLATTPDKINPDILQPLVEQLTSYKLLGSYNRQIARNPKQFEGIITDKEAFDKNLSELIRDVSRMTESVNKLALIRSAHIIKQTSSDPNLTIEKIEEELEVADRDITILSRLGDVGRELRDKTLTTLYTLISKVNSAAWRRTQEDLYSTETKKVDTKIDILIPNSNNPNFHWEQRSLKFNKTGKFKALQEYEKWLGKVDTFADKFAPVIDQNSKSKNDNGIQFISPWSKRGQEIRSITEGSKDYPLRQFYETFILDYLASQNNIPYKGLRPGLRVPSIQKSIMETLMEKGVGNKLQSIGEQVLNNFRRRYDEADYYAVDENGDRQEYIPTRYVSKQDGQNGRMNTDQVSLDIATTLTVFSNEMYSREGMEKIVSDLELIKHTVKNRQVLTNTKLLDTPGISSFLTAEREGNELESGEYEKKEGVESEAYKAFDAGMRQQVYGQLKKEEGAFKVGKNKFSVSKMTDALLKYSGFNILFGNIAIPLTNIIVGKVGTIREAVGGNIINMKNAIAGEKLFAKEGFTSIKDFGRREKISKLGRVFTYFNPYDHANVRGLGTDSNYAKAIFDKIITTGGAVAEFEIGVSTMGAVMDKFKAQKDGKDVSFYEAIDMDKNGKVKLNNGYTYKGKKEVSEEDIDEIKDYTLRLYQNIYGVNNKIDKAQSNEYAIGRLVGFMRGWFMPNLNSKWRTRFYDERLKMDQEGHYLSTIIAFNNVFTGEEGFILKMVDTLRILTWQGTNNPELLLHPIELEYSDERKQELINLRKANIRKTMFELYMIVGLYALLALGWDDDDNDSYVKYLALRTKREILTFLNPSTTWSILRSPTVALNTIDGMTRIIFDAQNSITAAILDEDQPVFERGPGKSQNKLWFDIKRQSGLNALTQFEDMATKVRIIRDGIGK